MSGKIDVSSLRLFFTHAEQYLARGEYDACAQILDAITRSFTDKYVLSNVDSVRGSMHFAKGEFDLAEKSFRSAVERNSSNLEAWQKLGDLYMQDVPGAGVREEEAVKAFEAATSVDAHDVRSRHELGTIYLARGDANKAADYFQVVVKYSEGLAAADPAAYADMNYLCGGAMMKADRFGEAEMYYLQAEQGGFDARQINKTLLGLYVVIGDYKSGLARAERMREFDMTPEEEKTYQWAKALLEIELEEAADDGSVPGGFVPPEVH